MRTELDLTAVDRGNFAVLARCMALNKGHPETTLAVAKSIGAGQYVLNCAKALVSGHGLSDPNSEALGEYQEMAGGFVAALAEVGAFDAILVDMRPGTLHTSFSLLAGHGAASEHGEGIAAPVTRMIASSGALDARKATGLVALSLDLLRRSTSTNLIEQSLRISVARATDQIFISELLDAATTIASFGPDAVYADIRRALLALPSDKASRLYIVMGTDTAKRLATMEDSTGALRFPGMTPYGGTLAGLPVVTTGELSDSVLLIDAAGLAGVSDEIALRTSTAGTLDMTDPTTTKAVPGSNPVAGTHVSLFQTNSAAIMADRWFGFAPLRACCVEIFDALWGMEGSPPA